MSLPIDPYCFFDFYSRLILPYSQAKQYYEKQIFNIDPNREITEFYDFYMSLKDEKQRGTIQDNLDKFYSETRADQKALNAKIDEKTKKSQSKIFQYPSYKDYKKAELLKDKISDESAKEVFEEAFESFFWVLKISEERLLLQKKIEILNLMLNTVQNAERHMTAITQMEFNNYCTSHEEKHNDIVIDNRKTNNRNLITTFASSLFIVIIGCLISAAIGEQEIKKFFYDYLPMWIAAGIIGLLGFAVYPIVTSLKNYRSGKKESNKN